MFQKSFVSLKKIKIYEEVLKKCHHRIKLVSKLTPMNQWCFYLIPLFYLSAQKYLQIKRRIKIVALFSYH